MAVSEINLPMREIVLREEGNKGSTLAKEQAIIMGTHQHYKGGIYQIVMECPHSETNETLVIRKHLWPYGHSYKAVPKDLFWGEVAPGVPRYRLITELEKEHAEAELRRKYA
jgi:hypothetical protein